LIIDSAMKWLWGIAILNLALGAVVWAFNTIQIVGDELNGEDLASAIVWQSMGSSLWAFGVLVFIVILAVSAVIDYLESNRN